MIVPPTPLPGVLIVEPQIFGDARGFFVETWQAARYHQAGISAEFVQDNVSFSRRGVLRGLHLQHPNGQDKLVTVLEGEVFDVAVDVRVGSPHFGKSTFVMLSGENKRQLFIPRGFAHGFCVTSETALFMYKCSDLYSPGTELGVIYDDPDLAIAWPIAAAAVSEKDSRYPRLRDIDPGRLPKYATAPTDR
jgi:dTDP-4-dehydrorhamnose 3,5-epimerase